MLVAFTDKESFVDLVIVRMSLLLTFIKMCAQQKQKREFLAARFARSTEFQVKGSTKEKEFQTKQIHLQTDLWFFFFLQIHGSVSCSTISWLRLFYTCQIDRSSLCSILIEVWYHAATLPKHIKPFQLLPLRIADDEDHWVCFLTLWAYLCKSSNVIWICTCVVWKGMYIQSMFSPVRSSSAGRPSVQVV